jgi:hypothetical protein
MKNFILLVAFFWIAKVSAQEAILNQKISIEIKNLSIDKALTAIEKQIGFHFTYDADLIKSSKKINMVFRQTPLSICLDSIFQSKNLIYKIIENYIVIKPKQVQLISVFKTDTLSQNIEVRGKIIDQQNKHSIAFATVSIKNKSIGVISNLDGEFILKIPENLAQSELLISHIGYENFTEKVDNLKNKYNLFILPQSYVPIQEVVIRNTDPKHLIRQAMNRLDKNYPQSPQYLTAFYRETVMRNGSFMFFSEALLKIYKTSYSKNFDNDQIKVLKSRKMKNISLTDTVILKMKSGLQTILLLDIIKNKIDFLDTEHFDKYSYKMTDIVSYNNRTSYAIDFVQKNNIEDDLYQGTVYIDTDNLAVIGAEFKINPQKIDEAQNRFIIKKTRTMKLKLLDTKYLVHFRCINNQFYLSHVRGELKIKVRKKNKLFPILFETTLELITNQIDSVNVERFDRKEIEDLTDIFSDVQHRYDETFWENYNFIKPEDSWEEAIKVLYSKTLNR